MGHIIHHISDDFHKAGDAIKHTADSAASDMHNDMGKFISGASAAEKKFAADATIAAKKMGPAFKIAGKDMEWAAGKSW